MYTKNVEKYCCRLETCSTVALSPRGQDGYYEGIHFKREEMNKAAGDKKFNIIYPFYQYGCYEKYDPEHTQYYIPGSSVKGAVGSSELGIDDMIVDPKDIELKKLYKLQHCLPVGKEKEDNKKVKLDDFFPQLAVEMMRAGVKASGDVFCKGDLESILSKTRLNTEQKLLQLHRTLGEIIEKSVIDTEGEGDTKTKEILYKVWKNIKDKGYESKYFEKNTAFIFLGGFKGLLLSKIYVETDTLNGGIYIDRENELPHGLVKITLERRKDD